jgi:hypothetical protein
LNVTFYYHDEALSFGLQGSLIQSKGFQFICIGLVVVHEGFVRVAISGKNQ